MYTIEKPVMRIRAFQATIFVSFPALKEWLVTDPLIAPTKGCEIDCDVNLVMFAGRL